MRTILLFVVAALCLYGCGYVKPTENQRQAHQQTIGAADYVEKNAVQPDVKQAGADAKLTAQTNQDTLIGKPETVKPYSHQESVKIVEKVVKEYDESKAPWYKRWAGTLMAGLTFLIGAAAFVGRFYPPATVVAGIAQTANEAILKPVASMLTDAKVTADAHKDDVLPLDTLQTKITALTKIPGIGPMLEKFLAQAHTMAAVHAPEGPDPAPQAPPQPTP